MGAGPPIKGKGLNSVRLRIYKRLFRELMKTRPFTGSWWNSLKWWFSDPGILPKNPLNVAWAPRFRTCHRNPSEVQEAFKASGAMSQGRNPNKPPSVWLEKKVCSISQQGTARQVCATARSSGLRWLDDIDIGEMESTLNPWHAAQCELSHLRCLRPQRDGSILSNR